jgi:hypothetical protein
MINLTLTPWVADLPPSEIFHGHWLACDKLDGWFTYERKPHEFIIDGVWHVQGSGAKSLEGVKMPLLDGEEWKHSLINIEDLDAWQVRNKK